MKKKDTPQKSFQPIIKITILDYDLNIQDFYSQKFMLPLVEGLLKRTLSAQAK